MAIAIDTTTALVRDTSADSGDTFAHDGGSGSDRLTTLFLYTTDLSIAVTATYNGVSMVEQAKVLRNTAARESWLFTKYGTSTGTNNIVLTYSPNSRSTFGAITVSGADQTDTIDGSDTLAGNGASATVDPSPSVAGCVVLGIATFGSDNNGITADSNTVLVNYSDIANMIRSTDVPIVASGSYPIGGTFTSGDYGLAAISIAPASGGGATTNNSARRMHLMMM